MNKLEDVYGDKFFRKRNSLSWRVPYVCNAIIKAYPAAKSIVDVGCAIGDYTRGFLDRGIVAGGIEGSSASKSYWVVPNIQIYDLRKLFATWEYDLAMCFEVLEHVEPEYAGILVQNLINLSNNILVSAAPPGQLGVGHVNCQPKKYWIELFDRVDYIADHNIVNIIRNEWQPVKEKRAMRAYYQNLMAFRKK